ncbi:MAG TPA: CoA transferase [Candidatus Dormibacteraeota bacterium]|nr:CoA transferase [Candidatus Dormibacteraeota bacterium]
MLPLEDLRVVAVEQYGAGPFGTLLLADLGAEVIKIEDPSTGGDVGRYVPPFQEGEDSLFFQTFNRNKRSLSLDMGAPAGRAVFEDLVRRSDAVYSNLRGDIPERLRIRYQDLKEVNPRIVCVSLSGFGMTGPRRADPAYDYLLQGIGGWMSLTGEPGGPPTRSGLSLVDYSGGLVAAMALLAGVHAARRDGIGMDCDLSLFDVAIGMTGYLATWYLNEGFRPSRTPDSAHPSLVPFQNFQTADDWIVVACAKEKFWRRLAAAIGRPELAEDARFRDFAARREHAEELCGLLGEVFRSAPAAVWLDRLRAAGVPCAPVNTLEQALADPQTEARQMVIEVEHPRWGRLKAPASPLRVGSQPSPRRRAPARHGDARDLLMGLLGYSERRVEELARAGAFGAPARA